MLDYPNTLTVVIVDTYCRYIFKTGMANNRIFVVTMGDLDPWSSRSYGRDSSKPTRA